MTAKQLWLGWLGGLGVLLALGCGGDDPPPEPPKDTVCEQRTATIGTLREKAAPCPNITLQEGPACFNATTRCGDADKERLEQFFTCLEQVPACVAGEELAFVGEQVVCQDTLRGLTEGCARAVGIKDVPPSTGSIQVEIDAPPYVSAAVTVSGPNGFSRTLAATTTIDGLPPGDYAVKAEGGRKDGPAGTTFYDVTVSAPTVRVEYGQTTGVSVRYHSSPRSAQLWVTSGVHSYFLSAATLDVASEYTRPERALAPANSLFLQDVSVLARDAAGDVWVASCSQRLVSKFRQEDLVSSGTPLPVVTLETGNHLDMPLPIYCGIKGLAFDQEGTLWVSGDRRLAGYTKEQQQAGGSVSAPAVRLTLEGTSPILGGLAFDGADNLWVTSTLENAVHMLGPDQRQSSRIVKPQRSVLASQRSLSGPTALAFVGSNLWVANENSSTLARFSASQLLQGGPATPAMVVTGSFPGQIALAADAVGGLWVAAKGVFFSSTDPGDVLYFKPSDLTGSGTVALTPAAKFRPVNNPSAVGFVGEDLLVSAGFAYEADPHLVRIPASELTRSTPAPSAQFKVPPYLARNTSDMAFDAQGALWVIDSGLTNKVFKYEGEPTSLVTRATPTVVLTLSASRSLSRMAFDAAGNLWVAGLGIDKYGAGRLGSSSSAPADATLEPSSQFLAMAFNAQDELFVMRLDGAVVKYTASARETGGTPISLGTVPFSGFNEVRMGFAPTGDLLITLSSEGKLLRYAPDRLTSGNFTPNAVVEGLPRPSGLAFDASQRLWVTTNDGLLRLGPAAQLQSGPAQPAVKVIWFFGGNLAFRPARP